MRDPRASFKAQLSPDILFKAERVGFEPTILFRVADFQSAPLNHFGISPL